MWMICRWMLPLTKPCCKRCSRLCAQVLCDGKPTEADMQTVLHTLKQVLESNDMPITYYDITLVPTGDYADHSAFMADVLESGLTSADTIA